MTPLRPLLFVSAALLVAVVAFAGLYLAVQQRAQHVARPTIVVRGVYRGGNAQTVVDTVAVPIEQQLNGAERLVSMTSRSANDGSYTLSVEFERGTDLDLAQVLVQDRVRLAEPMLPDVVRGTRLSVRKEQLEPLLFVGLSSPDRIYDEQYLSNYAALRIKEELTRLPGVGHIALYGHWEQRLRVYPNAARLADAELSLVEVADTLRMQNLQVSPHKSGLTIAVAAGQRIAKETWSEIVVKVSAAGDVVRLKDVTRLEILESAAESTATLSDEPAVILALQPLYGAEPRTVSQHVREKIMELRSDKPHQMSLDVVLDFSEPHCPEYLIVDLDIPGGAPSARIAEVLKLAGKVARQTDGVESVLAMSEHPLSLHAERACLIVILATDSKFPEHVAFDLRARLLKQVPGVKIQTSVPNASQGFPVYGYPIDFFVEDLNSQGQQLLWERADALASKMNESKQFVDARVDGGLRSSPAIQMEIDFDRCLELGLPLNKVKMAAFQLTKPADLETLRVKNDKQELLPLSTVVRVTATPEPTAILRHNLCPAVHITANLAPGVSLRQAKAACETFAVEALDAKSFRLGWNR